MSTPIPGTAAGYFGGMVESYDSLIRRAVPRYAEMTERLLEYLPEHPRSILELGCGTGNLTLRLAERYPQARITTVDAAPEMIELTRTRLRDASPRAAEAASFVTARFEALDFTPGTFDLITSVISLHHVVDKGALYRSIYRWLANNGTFRFADQLAGASTRHSDINWRNWLAFCAQPGNCSEAETQSLIDHAHTHDHYTALPEHLALLTAAGFAPMKFDCVWRNWMWGIVTADR